MNRAEFQAMVDDRVAVGPDVPSVDDYTAVLRVLREVDELRVELRKTINRVRTLEATVARLEARR